MPEALKTTQTTSILWNVSKDKQIKDIVIFENALQNRSVKYINHYHLIAFYF